MWIIFQICLTIFSVRPSIRAQLLVPTRTKTYLMIQAICKQHLRIKGYPNSPDKAQFKIIRYQPNLNSQDPRWEALQIAWKIQFLKVSTKVVEDCPNNKMASSTPLRYPATPRDNHYLKTQIRQRQLILSCRHWKGTNFSTFSNYRSLRLSSARKELMLKW
jgi:hypothetical protein